MNQQRGAALIVIMGGIAVLLAVVSLLAFIPHKSPINFSSTPKNSGNAGKLLFDSFPTPPYLSDVFNVQLSFDKNSKPRLKVISITKARDTLYKTPPVSSGYKLQLLGENNKQLTTTTFVAPVTRHYDNLTGNSFATGGIKVLDKVEFTIKLPYNPQARNLKLADAAGNIIDTQSVPQPQSSLIRLLSNLSDMLKNTITPKAYGQTEDQPWVYTVAFVPSGYGDVLKDSAAQKAFHDDVLGEGYRLRTMLEPFKSRFEAINWTAVDTSDVCAMRAPRNSDDVFANCDIEKVLQRTQQALGYTPTTTVVMANYPVMTWSYVDSWNRVAVVKAKGSPSTLGHELGHAVGQLIDEYTSDDYGQDAAPNGTLIENCWRGTPPANWQRLADNNTAVKGCGYYNWYRTTQTSLMQNVSQLIPYNPISEYFVRSWIDYYTGRGPEPPEAAGRQAFYPPRVIGDGATGIPDPSPQPPSNQTPIPNPSGSPSATTIPTAGPVPTNPAATTIPQPVAVHCTGSASFTATAIPGRGITITWETAADDNVYLIRYVQQHDNGSWPTESEYHDLGTFRPPMNQYTHTEVEEGKNYAYHLAISKSSSPGTQCGPIQIRYM